jgi:hypothetical protein
VEEFRVKKEFTKLKLVRDFWRKKKPLRKLYNTVNFIRKIFQQREVFLSICKSEIDTDIKDT